MKENRSTEVFENAPVRRAVLQNALPAMAAMLMVLIYNLADTFFIGQTHDDLQVAAVSLATPVFLIFMAMGTVFGIGGNVCHIPCHRRRTEGLCEKGMLFLHVGLRGHGNTDVCNVPDFYGADTWYHGGQC